MDQNIKLKKNDIINQAQNALLEATSPIDDYYGCFPKDIKTGLISFKDHSTDMKTAYFICASKIINAVSKAENHLSKLPAVMIDADKHEDVETVLICDKILTLFSDLRKALNSFTVTSEKTLSNTPPSYSGLLTALSEFKIKLTFFMNSISSLQ